MGLFSSRCKSLSSRQLAGKAVPHFLGGFMKLIKIQLLKGMIWLCDKALSDYQDGALDQSEINWMVETRNDCLKKLKELQG